MLLTFNPALVVECCCPVRRIMYSLYRIEKPAPEQVPAQELRASARAGDGRGAAGQAAQVAPDLQEHRWRLLGFDGQGWIQAIGGLVIGLIALYSSFDHVYLLSHRITLHRQWGVWFIAASLAVVFLDAQLASRSRRGEEDRRIQDARTAAEERDRADQERNRAAQERNRAAEARERQAAAAERQGQGIALLRGAALLSARVQLEPSELNRSRLNAFLALLAEQALLDQLGPE